MQIEIQIDGRPIPLRRVGISRGKFYDQQSKEREAFRWKLKTIFKNSPMTVPLMLGCRFEFALGKSFSKAKRIALLGKPFEGRPDLDNLVKWICDVGQKILWEEDKQIVKLTNVEKVWAEEDKTTIVFEDATLTQAS